MNLKLIITGDGSHSIYREDLDEQYHSLYGAIRESMHIYINNGYSLISGDKIQVFEMGFGTGLNALLTCLKSAEGQKSVKYYSVEKFPLGTEITSQLNYPSFLTPGSLEVFRKIHFSEWNTDQAIAHFILHKLRADILDLEIPAGNDLVYFDAFSPGKEPLLWTEEVFKRLYDSLNPGGIFITYSAKGDVRRKLQSVGFKTEKLNGPPGKKHILQAVK